MKPLFTRRRYICVVLIAGASLLFIIPTILFMKVEGWDLMDAIYYCFVTLSTIGFGDFIPGQLG
ncbi:hypothetical protein DPMN_129353 [Dreissena polymorpha]|uniref:Potassium channel domain-containing protein n=1 Tax=Dreissena polymorpha TaxID=45954 RepID=A0A9D4H120_DREPO|nr:hypothetical protein DPMN_129353 [Dreissena polymorpha]